MRPAAAAAGTAAFVLAGPVVELGLGPYVLTGFEAGDGLPGGPVRVLGGALLAAALVLVAASFGRFARDGRGTPSPVAPPGTLVVTGVYRRLRHPMYVASTAGLVGEALLLRRPVLLVAAAAYVTCFALWTRLVEEPDLRRRFGASFDAYRAAVPGWWPARRPYGG